MKTVFLNICDHCGREYSGRPFYVEEIGGHVCRHCYHELKDEVEVKEE